MTDVEKAAFSRLGSRGIVINNPAGIEGIPATLQLHDGKVKISGKMLNIDMETLAEILSKNHIKIDASRIDLG